VKETTYNNVSIILPILRETALFEQVITEILDCTNHADICEFVIVVHPEKTARESFGAIESMRKRCEQLGVGYVMLEQKLPYMGGAMRDGIAASRGSHVMIQAADMACSPQLVPQLIAEAKKTPEEIILVSRYAANGSLGKGYNPVKGFINRLSQIFCQVLFGGGIHDYTYSYKICPAEYFREVNWQEVKHPFLLEQQLKFIRLGKKMREIPGQQAGGSQSGLVIIKDYLVCALKCRFMRKRDILKG
jgi:hypothetical protein